MGRQVQLQQDTWVGLQGFWSGILSGPLNSTWLQAINSLPSGFPVSFKILNGCVPSADEDYIFNDSRGLLTTSSKREDFLESIDI